MINVLAPAEVFPPGDFLREEIAMRGWTEAEFADILGRPAQAVSEILNGRKEITAETALAIAAALDTSPELWLNLQSAYRLHIVRNAKAPTTDVERRAALRTLVPVRELQKREWLPDTKDLDVLEAAVCALLGIEALTERPTFLIAARRSNAGEELTPEQAAWIARVRALGNGRVTKPFNLEALRTLGNELVHRLRTPTDLDALPRWLAETGVAMVIQLPLKASKIDGAVMIGADGVPLIGLSTRGDRMDGFIFTVLHEMAHLVLGHVNAGDVRLDEDVVEGISTGIEAEANELAATWIVPGKLDIGPGKPTMARIIATAQTIGVHPSLVIGRLQRDRILEWSDFRRSVPKVRPFVTIG